MSVLPFPIKEILFNSHRRDKQQDSRQQRYHHKSRRIQWGLLMRVTFVATSLLVTKQSCHPKPQHERYGQIEHPESYFHRLSLLYPSSSNATMTSAM